MPMVEIRSEIEWLWAVKSLGQSRSAWCILRQKALRVASGSGDDRAEKPRCDVPQGVGVKYRYEAELTNQRADRGQKPRCILLYRTVVRNGGGIPLSVVCPLMLYVLFCIWYDV